ncbi:hypothetical protein RQM59_02985 [Flavobacteriaceae bacterium S356]|uniref:DUF5067 domain-containing protein n=1 Tax=Asprobacillus argus TaxID=3076534 RepID=A0ABU3LC74_9FLAO|nr:hypothetical protein [Flavobacteriaceae bacterium S356]
MKVGIYILMTIGLMSCKSLKFEKTPPFQVTGATYNNWVGGQEGVSGMKVIIAYTSSENVTFEKILFYNKEANVETQEKEGKKYLVGFFDTSTRKDRDVIMDIDPKEEMKNKIPEKKPLFELKENEAVIIYVDGETKKYVKVENIKQTKTDFYP